MPKHIFMFCFSVVPLVLLVCNVGAGPTLYAQPTANAQNSSCPQKPCETLEHYSTHPRQYFKSDTTVVFLDGRHEINIGGLVPITSVSNLEFRTTGAYVFVDIVCKNSTGFAFLNVSNLSVSNTAFHSCGARIGYDLQRQVMSMYTNASQLYRMSERQQIAILLAAVFNLNMSSLVIQNSTGYGLLGFNVLGQSVIGNSSFVFNNYYTLNSQVCWKILQSQIHDYETIQDCVGGNALFIYSEHTRCLLNDRAQKLLIENSSFAFGVDLTGKLRKLKYAPNDNVVFGGAGISAKVAPTSYSLEIILDGVNTSANCVDSGPNMNFQSFDFVNFFALTIQNCICENGNVLLSDDLGINVMEPLNSGFYYYRGLKLSTNYNSVCWTHLSQKIYKNQINIVGSTFTRNKGFESGGMMLFFHPRYDYHLYEIIKIEHCIFKSNSRGAIVVSEQHGPLQNDITPLEVVIINSHFWNNFFNSPYLRPFDTTFPAAAIFESTQNVTIKDCTFSSNTIPAIEARHATLYMQGEILIYNNTGDIGAGISLLYESFMVLPLYTKVVFVDNYAHSKGGAIYVQKSADEDLQACFYQVMNPNALKITELYINILLINNTSGYSGGEVYGGTVDNCTQKYVSNKPGPIAPWVRFDYIFFGPSGDWIKNDAEQPSLISSDPQQVCHCPNGLYNLNMTCPQDPQGELFFPVNVSISVFPGALFQVLVATVGQRKGLVQGVVRAVAFPESNKQLPLGDLQATQSVNGCAPVSYQVFSTSSQEQFGLAVDRAGEGIQYASISLQVTLLPCPPGFSITNALSCICAPPLLERGLHCNITEKTIERKGTVWVSIASPGNESGSFLLHDHCPFDYCNASAMKVVLSDPDKQCVYSRSGILCGHCKSAHSAVFGSSKCLKCGNQWISLLAVFIIAGIMLIAFLIFFNFTVSIGTISGLILFANVVRVNNSTFFPPAGVSPFLSVLRSFLSIFIAWLNLDIGIELCFFKGMRMWHKVLLQFAFPIYIWTLVSVIIFAARRSVIVVKIIGSSAVSVLATLFILSYAKILQTTISIYSFTDLTFPDKSVSLRWLLDGNIVMAKGKHIPLLVVALAFSVCFIIPFTLMLLFAPCIQARSGNWLLGMRWIRNVIPLLDAYQAPYNIEFRFWTGLLLVVRIVLFLAFAINALGDPKINLLITVTMVIFLLTFNLHFGYAYKTRLLNLIESSFIINLGVLSLWSSFIKKDSTDSIRIQLIITCLMTGLAFLKFTLIFCYHVYLLMERKKILSYFMCRCRCCHNGYEKLSQDDKFYQEPVGEVVVNVAPQNPQPTTSELILSDSNA